MDKPRRLSTDIDIIVQPGTDLDEYLKRAAEIFPFQHVDEQRRFGGSNIEKRHFKFLYDSPMNGKSFYILLDVLFEENHYEEIIEKEIRNELLLTEPEYLTVKIPSPDCILADKLTAFAPHTSGILLGGDKDMEVIKQMYDVTTLLDVFTDNAKVRNTYANIVASEIQYRGIDKTPNDCLTDTFAAALCIASRGRENNEDYRLYVEGIRALRGHIYAENYTPEVAAISAVKVMYMAACLLTGEDYTKVQNYTEYMTANIGSGRFKNLTYLKRIAPEAYAYAVKTHELVEIKGLTNL
jgi:hypothetical protein